MEIAVERRIQIHGSCDAVIELFDNWEGMGLLSVQFGAHDGEGSIAWTADPNPLDADMARALAEQLVDYADRQPATRRDGEE